MDDLANATDDTLGDALIGVKQPYTGAVSMTQHDFNKAYLTTMAFGITGAGDETTRMQSAINAAAAAGLRLICTVPQITVTQLYLPTGIQLDLGTTVLKRADGANVPLLRNSNNSFTAGTYGNSDIRIYGGVLDFNGMNQADVGTDGAWLVGMRFAGVRGLHFLNGVRIKNSRRFNVFICNCRHVRVTGGITIENDPAIPSTNKDGIHINGKTSDVVIDVVSATYSDDDAVALNADDDNFGGDLIATNINGPIDDVTIGSVVLKSSRNGVRLLSATNRIRNVHIGSISGEVSVYAFNVEDYGLGTSSWYQDINVGSIDCVFGQRPYPLALSPMVNINTLNHSINAYSNFHIGQIHRSQEDVDGQDRSTIVFSPSRTELKVGHISERNCSHLYAVQILSGSGGVKFELARFQRFNSRASGGIYTTPVRVTNATGVIDYVKIGEIQADRLQLNLLIENSTVGQVDMEALTQTDVVPIYLTSSVIRRLYWKSFDIPSYGLYSRRYQLTGTGSAVQFERPAPLGGTSAQRPINPAYGDNFLDITLGKPIWWNGRWIDSTGASV
ncbi:hypothetical protein AT395_00225 [Pandoraea apista]|nr:hypothetical protein AT395_00225 [Pandoraea apista]